MNTKRRISFSQFDAAHLYDLALEHFCVSKKEGKGRNVSYLRRFEKTT